MHDETTTATWERLAKNPQDPAMPEVTVASQDEVRGLFVHELSRLERGAKIRTYLHVLTLSNVRTMLRRAGRVSAVPLRLAQRESTRRGVS